MKSNTTRKVISIVLAILMIFLGIWLIMSLFPQRNETPDYLEFLEQVENGEIAVVMVGDEDATVKRFFRGKGIVTLMPQSTNPEHTPQIYDPTKTPVKVIGRVMQTIIRY